ncbi:transposase [Geitlerinema sp. PCC 9228]|uniref:transposase n=1 Tax=Geitlerinema sp. PCC 9228 TaxID=111611 RepID=UPI0008F9BFA3|nr:transposase [Geitlerinema sp. PCC 9228]
MKYDPNIHKRRSIRLKGYDYSQPGAYFVTICINQGLLLLGKIKNGQLYLSEAGQMVHKVWNEIPIMYPGVETDAFVIMPNHIHGIIVLTENSNPPRSNFHTDNQSNHTEIAPMEKSMALGDVVHRFKSLTTTKYRYGVQDKNWPPFVKRLWQRNYYEVIVRNRHSLNKIREYINNNPLAWEQESEHWEQYHPQPDFF